MTTHQPRKRLSNNRLATWLSLCAIVFLQLQIASYTKFEHGPSGSHGESCETCLKLDKNGNAPLTLAAMSDIAPDGGSPALGSALNPSKQVCRLHSARGPPAA